MLAPTNVQRSLKAPYKPRWAVWIDDHRPLVVASRLQAKKLCAQAKEVAYFCKWQAGANTARELNNVRISDFLVWQLNSDGRFARFMYLLPADTLSGLTFQPFGFSVGRADYARYKRALDNPGIWKLGSKDLLKSFGRYPDSLDEITADSDLGMICAGYRCIGEVATITELRTALSLLEAAARYCGTVDGTALKIWVDANN